MEILRSIDIEDTVREVLADHLTVYCRPLPKDYTLPCILVSQVGGSDSNQVDTFEIVLDSRAEDEATALLTLRNAVGILRQAEKNQNTPINSIIVNSSGSWGSDPVRPDLAMCSARVRVTAHLESTIIN
jgi:hypothetical protein